MSVADSKPILRSLGANLALFMVPPLLLNGVIFGLGWTNWSRLGVWLVLGLIVYFGYSIKHSKLRKAG